MKKIRLTRRGFLSGIAGALAGGSLIARLKEKKRSKAPSLDEFESGFGFTVADQYRYVRTALEITEHGETLWKLQGSNDESLSEESFVDLAYQILPASRI